MKSIFILLFFFGFLSGSNQLLVSGSKLSKADVKKALEMHNEERKLLNIPPLEWSDELSIYAQEWADHLANEGGKLKHRPDEGKWKSLYGENLYWSSKNSNSIEKACKAWLKEKKYFNNIPIATGSFTKSGHYSQMIWKKSAKLGMGVAVCKNGAVIVVANYDPPGNYIGEKAY